MWRQLKSRTPWLVALACAAAAAYFLDGLEPAVYIAPAMAMVAVLLLWLRPWAGGLVAVLGMATELLLDVPAENPSWLATVVVVFNQLGRRAPSWQSWVLIGGIGGTCVALGQGPASQRFIDAAFLTFVVGSAWGLGRAVRRRAMAAERARAEAERLAAEDSAVVVARVVEEERRRLAAELVGVVTDAVTAMRADARRAGSTLATEAIASIASRGALAMTEMRRLIGLLRAEPEDGVVRSAESPSVVKYRHLWLGRVTSLALVAVWFTEMEGGTGQANLLAQWPLVLVVAAMWIRLTRPVAAATLLLVPVLAAVLFGGPTPGVAGLTGAVAFGLVAWSVGARGDVWGFGVLAVLGLLAVLLAHEVSPGNEAMTIAWIALPLVCGYLWTHFESLQEIEERRARERQAEIDAEVARAVTAERIRVARELHDVTSHALGVMVLQAGAAEATAESKPDVARAALAEAVAAGDEALSELARLSRIIGPPAPTEDGDSFGAQVEGLVSRMRAAGLRITLAVDVEPRDPVIAQTAYRVAQEALTNVARHARGAQVSLRICEAGDGLEISVADDGGPGDVMGTGSGFGLVGLAERVRALGGTLAAGPRDAGGFSVQATIPLSTTTESPGLTAQHQG
ncbi:MAG TPA: histidine kinase [Actinomycetales bacterium]|nr:histidine kinase [Actinomycetales bacterium]